jgi:hypothetical protein
MMTPATSSLALCIKGLIPSSSSFQRSDCRFTQKHISYFLRCALGLPWIEYLRVILGGASQVLLDRQRLLTDAGLEGSADAHTVTEPTQYSYLDHPEYSNSVDSVGVT